MKKTVWPVTGRVEEIEFIDHTGRSGWCVKEKYLSDEPCRCRSVGYVVNETKHKVSLVQSQDADAGNLDNSMVIAKKLILSRRILRRK